MHLLALLLIAATPATAARAHSLASSKAWEELYLAFSAANPSGYPPPEREAIAGDLQKGCQAILGGDKVMAFSLGERAVAFAPTRLALLCMAKAAAATDQHSAAEQALRTGLATFPKEGAFGLELGRLLLDEKDGAGAQKALGQVPKRSPQYKEAQRLLSRARATEQDDAAARHQVENLQARIDKGEGTAGSGSPPTPSPPPGPKAGGSLTYESGVGPDGMRTRGNSRFLLKYFNNNRDFGQRADYEGHVVEALDEAHDFALRILGVAREAPCDVILYTREEFAAHFSSAAASRVAGLYFMNAIRMNDAADINPQAKATLVHEYIHSVVDDVTASQAMRLPHWLNEGLAEYVEWRYQGTEDPPAPLAMAMRAAAKGDRIPSLQQMDRGAPINSGNPAVAYGVSTTAVKLMLKNGGVDNLMALIHEVGSGASFESTLEKRYGKTVTQLQEQVHDELAQP